MAFWRVSMEEGASLSLQWWFGVLWIDSLESKSAVGRRRSAEELASHANPRGDCLCAWGMADPFVGQTCDGTSYDDVFDERQSTEPPSPDG